MEKEPKNQKPKLSFMEFISVGEVGKYFFRGKEDPKPTNTNLRIMHGINKLAIIIFIAGVVYIVLKFYVF